MPPSQVSEATHWDQWNTQFRTPGAIVDQATNRRMQEVLESFEQLKIHDAQILEIGCGTGWLSSKLKRFGKVTGVDLGIEIIADARRREPDINFRSGDIFEMPFSRGEFDAIVIVETISCVSDQQKLIELSADLLKPSGWLIVATQNKFVYQRRAEIGPAVGHIRRWLSMKELTRLVLPYFSVTVAKTLEPEGHLGVLRYINSTKLTKILCKALGASRLKLLKERLGLGQTLFLVAQKR